MTTRNAYLILVLVVFVFVVYLILNPDKLSDTWFGEKAKQQAEKEPAERPKLPQPNDDTVYLDEHVVSFTRVVDGRYFVYGAGSMYYVVVTHDMYININKQLNIASVHKYGVVRLRSRYWKKNYPEAITIQDTRP